MEKFEYFKRLLNTLLYKRDFANDTIIHMNDDDDSSLIHGLIDKIENYDDEEERLQYDLVFKLNENYGISLEINKYYWNPSQNLRISGVKRFSVLEKFPYLREYNQDRIIEMIEIYLMEN